MRTARLPHIYWMIEHHPEDDSISRGLCDLAPDTPLATRSDYEYGRSLWLAQTAKNSDNARVRQNAARYFDPYDLQLAIENLQAAVRAPNNAGVSARMQLARLYSRILRASLAPPVDPGERPYLADPALITRIKSDLENTSDVQMLMLIGGLPDPEFTAKLSARIRALNPDGAVASLAAGPPIPGSIRVGGNVQASKLIRQPAPEYPALAKQARIQGTVRFTVVIGKDGTVQNITLVSGHPLLVPPAQDAVRQWVYQPTLLNGSPVDVITTVDVNFTLSDMPAPPVPNQVTPQ
jgi:TonB family protein